MLAFFRRLINSKVGLIIMFGVLIAAALAFGLSDVTGLASRATSTGSPDVAVTVGKTSISATELRQRMTSILQAQQQRNPGVTMQQLIAAGAFEQVVDGMIDDAALAEYGQKLGMVVTKRTIDGQIAGIPGLQGPDGKFNEAIYRQRLAAVGITDAQIRAQLTREELDQQLRAPMLGATQLPTQLVIPYARLLLETRTAALGFVPFGAMPAGAAPTDAELQAFYREQASRYTLPERRLMRYAVVSPDAVAAQAVPTDAEIASAFAAQAARFAPKETRDIEQVVVLSQNDANALAAKVKGSTSLADAAKAAGLDAATLKGTEKAAYAGQTTPEIANAVFGASQGALVGPLRSQLGFVIARVAAITHVPGKSLAQARPDLVKELTAKKSAVLMQGVRQRLEAGLNNNATFDELVNASYLTATTTAPLTSRGLDPTVPPPAQPDIKLSQVAAAGFAAGPNDPPQLVPTAQDGSFAVVQLAKVLPPAPRPLAEIRDRVLADLRANRARTLARKAAADILAKVNSGTPLAAALAASGYHLPAPKNVTTQRIAVFNPRQAPSPAQAIIFSLAKGKANMVEDPALGGFVVVQLVSTTPGDLRSNPTLVGNLQSDFGRSAGAEYVQQLTQAARKAVGVTRNDAAIAGLKSELAGTAGAAARP